MPEQRLPQLEELLRRGSAPALAVGRRSVSYAELDQGSGLVARRLAGAGVQPGDRVALAAPLSVAWICSLLGAVRAGAVVVLIDPALPALVRAQVSTTTDCRFDLARLPATSGGRPAEVAGDQQLPATALLTSGSTGTPKAVIHTVANHLWSAAGAQLNLPLGPGDRWLWTLPPHHIGGLSILWRCLLAGAMAVIPESRTFRADSDALTLTVTGEVTHLSLVATQLQRLLEKAPAAPATLRGILVGGGPAAEGLLRAARGLGWPVLTTYGSTEAASQVTTLSPRDSTELLATAGRVLPYRELRISAEGEILVRGPTLCAGYLDRDGLHPAAGNDGWFHTGDAGHLDDRGYLAVSGRTDQMFVSGGENIHPEAIEEALLEHPDVTAAVVVPVADAEFGHRPLAVVAVVDPPPTRNALASHLSRRIPRFMLPIGYRQWSGPGETALKPGRAQVRELLAAGALPELP